jgi:hypothetical protein
LLNDTCWRRSGKKRRPVFTGLLFLYCILLYGYCLHRTGIGGFLTITGTAFVGSDNMRFTIILYLEDLGAEFLTCGTTLT